MVGLRLLHLNIILQTVENIHKIGIKPDIEVKIPDELLSGAYDRSKDPQFNKALEVVREKLK